MLAPPFHNARAAVKPRLILLLALLLSPSLFAAPNAQYWAEWDRSDELNPATIDHSSWDAVLRKYVVVHHKSGINRFRYGEVSPADKARLDSYIEATAAIDPRAYSRPEQLAYWINLYNALTVKLVLDHYPVAKVNSIQVAGADASDGPWSAKLVKVGGTDLSLDDIEHRILRPIWKDHRVLFGLACAGLGCPDIQPQACTGLNSRELLRSAGRDFINSDRGVSIDGIKGPLRASSIFEWYQSDFAADHKALLKLFAHYAEDRKALYLLGYTGDIQYHQDWTLNAP